MATGKAAATVEAIELEGVRLTHPDRVLYPDQGITKRALAEHYLAVAERMLPHLAGRPLSLVRCPGGEGKHCFFQRHDGSGVPEQVERIEVAEEDGPATYLVVRDAAGLVALVQMGVLEIHVWGAVETDLDRPDRIVLDLDPDPALPWQRTIEAATMIRQDFNAMGLQSFVKTTGGKGLHVVVPVAPNEGWDAVRDFARAAAEAIADEAPTLYTTNIRKDARGGRIFIDTLRNARSASAVAPWSTRARPGAPIATPLAWAELPKAKPQDFTIAAVRERLSRPDPWADMPSIRQTIPAAAKKALGL
jgi:bifunctional non-homologous end joining protein LigD